MKIDKNKVEWKESGNGNTYCQVLNYQITVFASKFPSGKYTALVATIEPSKVINYCNGNDTPTDAQQAGIAYLNQYIDEHSSTVPASVLGNGNKVDLFKNRPQEAVEYSGPEYPEYDEYPEYNVENEEFDKFLIELKLNQKKINSKLDKLLSILGE